MAHRFRPATIGDVRGGRNGVDPPLALREDECVDAVNVEWFQSTLGRKRRGMTAASVAFSSGGPFTGKISSVHRHVPGTDEGEAEQWAVDDALVIGRRAAATTFSAPTLKDSLTGNGWDVDFATLGGKCFVAYPGTTGFSTPAAPTVADYGSGSYAASPRYYRIRWTTVVSSITVSRSPVGASVAFTPSGSGSAARITRPAAATGATHWELEVSYSAGNFRVLYGVGGVNAAIAIATTTADDTAVLSAAVTQIESFTSSSSWTCPAGVTTVDYLVVGGGGGYGSGGFVVGGGGAGAMRTATGLAVVAGTTYSVVVGAAGAVGGNGGNSVFNGITALGGGAGGVDGGAGTNGGSGGGAGNASYVGSGGDLGTGNDWQSHAAGTGGTGGNNGGADHINAGGGGGGAGAVGGAASQNNGGAGGAGTASSLSGSSVTYSAGGAGGGITSDGSTPACSYGGGGGAGSRTAQPGIVILSYTAPGISGASGSISNSEITGRLHVWDGSTVRRAGFATPSAPTATNAGSGSYGTARYYRVRWTQQTDGITIRRSEGGTAVAFTPSGSGASVTVLQPEVADEGETHWEVEGSADGVTYYLLSAVAIATTTYSDSTAVSAYSSGTVSALTGTYTPQKSYRFIAADQGRLLGFGNWTSTEKQNDIEVSAVVGSLDVGDAERVDTTQTYRYSLDENDSGAPTGLRGPVFGNFYAFKARQFWELSPTGLPNNPYRRMPISKTIGCVQGKASCVGEDAQGNAALYFMSSRGMYRYGVGGLVYIGKGIEDYIIGPTASLNLSATNVIAWTLYYPFKRQVWVGWATGSSNDPCQTAIYDVASGGWSRVPTGDKLANIRCAHLFANTLAADMSPDLKPYLGSALTANILYRADDDTVTQDAGTSFRGYILTRPIEPGGIGFKGTVQDAILLAPAASGVTITATVIPDFDRTYAKTGSTILTATSSETRVSRRLENSALNDMQFVQYEIGDASAANNTWAMDRLVIGYAANEPVA